jgi:hypothetical protein
MKYLIFILIIISVIHAQNIYRVSPNTLDNEIILTVANESQTLDVSQVSVKVIKHCDAVKFNQQSQVLENIAMGKELDTKFVFDILRSAQVNQKDTLKFLIQDEYGNTWDKEIILEFMPPKTFALEQNFPNPFNPLTTIRYQIPETAKVNLEIYNTLGQKVATLVNKEQEAGYYDVNFNASRLASGVYVYRITAGKHHSVKKMMVLK